ncbi:MAG TPA: SdpI family protein [Candidatus Binataceae bacterium]|nr:SdpI family protein [Candidatus Binataceae bacterium]
MKLDWRREWPQWVLLAGMFVLAAIVWNRTPDRVPIHWDAAGNVNGYGSRFEGLLLQPMIGIGVYFLMIALPRIDPGRANYANFSIAYETIRTSVIALMAAVYLVTQLAIQGSAVNLGVIIPLMVGALMIGVGNVLPKLRPNWFVGIRTPWTLSSKTAWGQTHRFGGWLFVLVGFIFMLGVLLPPILRVIVWLPTIFGLILGLYVFSFVAWRNASDKVPPSGTTAA